MARKKNSLGINWQENWAGLVMGAVIIVIIGLLVANFLANRKGQTTETGEQTTSMEEASPSPKSYKVAAGDSLSKIAQKVYQDESYWPILAQANNIANPNVIYVDSELKVPAKSAAEEIKAQMTQTSYKVQSGDTLFSIAQKMYGDGSKWPIISKANNLGRLPNGNPLVFADSTIRIPR